MNILLSALKRHSLQLIFILSAFVSLIAVSFYYFYDTRNRTLYAFCEESSSKTASEVTALLLDMEAVLNHSAHIAELLCTEGADMSNVAASLGALTLDNIKTVIPIKSEGVFSEIYGAIDGRPINPGGVLFPSDNAYENEEWFQKAQNGGFLSGVYENPSGGLYVTMSKPITVDGVTRGVFAQNINLNALSDHVNNANAAQTEYGGYAFLLDGDKRFAVHIAKNALGKTFGDFYSNIGASSTKNLITALSKNDAVESAPFRDFNKRQSVGSFSRLYNGWTVGYVMPKASYLKPVRKMVTIMVFLTIVLSVLVSYFMILLSYEKMRSDEENQNKTSFVAKMSHELRTPLNAVLGMSELILREDIPHNIYENALSIKQASTNLLSIINDILDYSKIESGKLEIVPVNYQFSSLINDVVSIIRMRLLDKPIKLAVNIDCLVPNNLYGDEVRVRQVLINLLSNAVKYTKEGHIAVNIYGEIKEADIYEFCIDITDTGIGIRDEDLTKLFGDFVQINLAANKGVEGTGLGLVISRNICRAMGGDITVRSVYGEGSTFTAKITQTFKDYKKFAAVTDIEEKQVLLYETRSVYANSISQTLKNLNVTFVAVQNQSTFHEELKKFTYPYIFVSSFLFSSAKNILEKLDQNAKMILISEFGEVVTAKCDYILEMPAHCITVANVLNDVVEEAHSYDSADIGIRFVAPAARVLIVDDIATNLKVAEGLMSPYKMKVDIALSGSEAIDLIMRNRYDVVFMDHMMPGMDGIEATEKIRKLEDKGGYFQDLPIIALTAVAVSGVKEMFLQNGLNDFLAKPIEMVKLSAILEKWVPKEKQEKETITLDSETEISLKIEGLDVKVGLSMTGGTYDAYVKVLDIFYKDCVQKMDEISRALENNDLYLYTTYVHALKSASANVGALKVSEFAKSLELAGKNEDIMYITENNEEFFQAMRMLLKNIAPILRKTDGAVEVTEDDENKLKQRLTELKTALNDMDIGVVDTIVAELEAAKFAAGTRTAIADVFHSILMFEYDAAISKIDEILS